MTKITQFIIIMAVVALSSCKNNEPCTDFTAACEMNKAEQIVQVLGKPDSTYIDSKGSPLIPGRWYCNSTYHGLVLIDEGNGVKFVFKQFEDNKVKKVSQLLEYKDDVKTGITHIQCPTVGQKTFKVIYAPLKVKMLLFGPRRVEWQRFHSFESFSSSESFYIK